MEEENTGFMDKLAELIQNFEMEKFMPKLDSVIGWIEFAARFAVMIGPILLLVFGVIYFFFPPKEANHHLGYRFYWGMGSVEAWQFTQKIAGIGWTALGLILTLIMLLICNGYRGMDTMQIVNSAVTCLIWELVLTVVICLAIDVVVAMRYDRNGNVRPNTLIKVPDRFLQFDWKKMLKRSDAKTK